MSSWKASMPLRRIRMTTQDDFDSAYALLIAYAENSELASSVNEFVIDFAAWPGIHFRFENQIRNDEALDELQGVVESGAQSRLNDYVRSIGLEEKNAKIMLRSLAWKGQCPESQRYGMSRDFALANMDFAQTATVLLLSICKNITAIQVFGILETGIIGEYLLKSNYELLSQPGLQKLKQVKVASWKPWDERMYDRVELLEYFRYFGRLPAMETLTMDGVMEYQINRQLAPPGTSNIKKLHITHADISSGMLGTMIRIPRSLEEFKLSIGGLWQTDGGSPHILYKTLGKCLLEQKGSLRVLDLDLGVCFGSPYEKEDGRDTEYLEAFEGGEDERYDREKDSYFLLDEDISAGPIWSEDLLDSRPYGYTIGSLHDFATLTHLGITISALLGRGSDEPQFGTPHLDAPFRLIDALPPSLESLCVYEYWSGDCPFHDRHVQELMERKAERLPRLQDVAGINEVILLGSRHKDAGDHRGEESLWKRDCGGLDWAGA